MERTECIVIDNYYRYHIAVASNVLDSCYSPAAFYLVRVILVMLFVASSALQKMYDKSRTTH
jgi:hypothetical protein